MEALSKGLAKDGYHFYVGTSYRHLLIQNNGHVTELTPPHDILTKKIGGYLPEDEVLREMMVKSYDILKDHPQGRREKPSQFSMVLGSGNASCADFV